MIALDLLDAETGQKKKIRLDSQRLFVFADTAMLILFARLVGHTEALTLRYVSMINEFSMDEKELSRCFTIMSCWFYQNYAYPLSNIKICEHFFGIFAQRVVIYGSPFPNLIGIVDGNFMQCAQPGGAGNWISTMDQHLFYSGKKKAHCLNLKCLADIFPKGFNTVRLAASVRCMVRWRGLCTIHRS